MNRWYVVHCRPAGERKALFHLRRQGYDAYLPQYCKLCRHARRTVRVAAPLFPRYLFVRLELGIDHWRPIRSTVGVSHFVCHGDTPAPVPEGIVEAIQAREGEDGFVALNEATQFSRGDRVRLIGGALADQVGIFERVADDHRVIVLLDLLGRPVAIRLPLDVIGAVA